MKRAWRWLLICAGVIVLLLVLVVAVALNGSFQTSLALHFLRAQDPQAKLRSASFGLSGGELQGLELTTDGTKVSLDDASLSYSLSELLGDVKVIDRVTVKGLTVDVSAAKQSAKAAPAKGANSTAPSNGQSVAVLIKQVDLAATVMLPAQRSVTATLTAQDVGSGGNGTAQAQWVFTDNSKAAAVREIHMSNNLNLALDGQMQPLALNLTAQLAATLPGQAQPAQMTLQVTAAAPTGSGARDFTIDIAQPGAAGNTHLLTATGSLDKGGASSGNFTLNCTSSQVAPFALGVNLPDLNLQGSGAFSSDAVKGSGSVKAKLAAVGGNLAKLMPQLAVLGSLQLNAVLDATWTGESCEARAVNLALGPVGGKPVVLLDLLQPLTVDFSDQVRLTQGSGAQMARLSLRQVPVAWLALAAPANYTVTGGGLTGEAVLGARDDGTITVQMTKPLTLPGFSVTNNGAAALSNVSLALDAGAEYKAGAVTAELRELMLSSGDNPLAQLAANVSFGQDSPIKAAGRLAVSIDEIMKQPVAAAWAASLPNRAFKLDGTFDLAKTSDTLELDALQFGVAENTAPLFTLKLLQKISLPLNAGATMPAFSGDLATLEANGLPVELATPFLPKGMLFTGDPLRGRVVLAGGDASSLVLRTDEPLTLTRFNYSKDGTLIFSGVSLALSPAGTWDAGGVNGTAQLQVTAGAGTLLDATVQASRTDAKLTMAVAASGSLNALATQPIGTSWSQTLPSVQQNYVLSANITKDAANLTVQTAEARVGAADGSGATMAEVKLLQPVSLPETTGNATAAWPAVTGDVASVQLTGLPIGVLGLAMPGYDLRGETVSADLLLHGEGAGVYSVAANLPLSVGRLSVRHNYDTLVQDLTVGGRPIAKFSEAGLLSLTVNDLSVSSGQNNLLSGRIEYTPQSGSSLPSQAKFTLSANFAGLMHQPFLQAYNNLTSGQGTLDGELTPDGTFKLNADFTQWKVRTPARELKEMALTGVTGKLGPAAGAVQLTAPLQGTSAYGATNCTLSLTLTPNAASKGQVFSINLTGNGLVPNDVMAIVNGFNPPANTETARLAGVTPKAAPPETGPMWGDMTGSAQVNLKRLAFDALDLENVGGAAQMTPKQLTVANLTAQLSGGAPLNFNGTLAFDATQPSLPYGLQMALSLKGFDTGAYFRARDPKAKVPLEGNFSIAGTANGRGANMDDLIARVPFDFNLTSSGGTIYVLAMVNKSTGAALTGLSVVSGLAGIAGGIFGGKAPNVQQFSSTLTQLTTLFDNIKYTSMTFAATRGADRNINLTQINVQSTDIVVNGSGRITYQAGKPIPSQPLSVNVQLGVRGNPAALLSTLGLNQSSTPDANGFIVGPQFQVGGTLQKPDYGSFYQMLMQAPMKMLKL
jgi:hypothetical protein